jgi:hypothetical protein
MMPEDIFVSLLEGFRERLQHVLFMASTSSYFEKGRPFVDKAPQGAGPRNKALGP